MFFFPFLITFSFVTATSPAASYSLDRDLVEGIKEHLEPSLHAKFNDLQYSFKNRTYLKNRSNSNTNYDPALLAKERELIGATKSETAQKLLSSISNSRKTEDASFGLLAMYGQGDKYHLLLTLMQRMTVSLYFASALTTSLSMHVSMWRLFDSFSINSIVTLKLLRTKGLAFLDLAMIRAMQEMEKTMERLSDVHLFLQTLSKSTNGAVQVVQDVPTLPEYLAPNELIKLLGPGVYERFLLLKSTNIALVFDFIEQSSRRDTFKRAFHHWHNFQAGNYRLAELDASQTLTGTIPEGTWNDPEALLRFHVQSLRGALPKIFTWDQQLTSYKLYASWSLIQYLKYASRLISSIPLRQEIEGLVQEYVMRLTKFTFEIPRN